MGCGRCGWRLLCPGALQETIIDDEWALGRMMRRSRIDSMLVGRMLGRSIRRGRGARWGPPLRCSPREALRFLATGYTVECLDPLFSTPLTVCSFPVQELPALISSHQVLVLLSAQRDLFPMNRVPLVSIRLARMCPIPRDDSVSLLDRLKREPLVIVDILFRIDLTNLVSVGRYAMSMSIRFL